MEQTNYKLPHPIWAHVPEPNRTEKALAQLLQFNDIDLNCVFEATVNHYKLRLLACRYDSREYIVQLISNSGTEILNVEFRAENTLQAMDQALPQLHDVILRKSRYWANVAENLSQDA